MSHDQFRRAYFSTAALKQYEDKECDEDTKAQLRLDHLGFLFQNKWWRVIIDEAHAIKNYDTKREYFFGASSILMLRISSFQSVP